MEKFYAEKILQEQIRTTNIQTARLALDLVGKVIDPSKVDKKKLFIKVAEAAQEVHEEVHLEQILQECVKDFKMPVLESDSKIRKSLSESI